MAAAAAAYHHHRNHHNHGNFAQDEPSLDLEKEKISHGCKTIDEASEKMPITGNFQIDEVRRYFLNIVSNDCFQTFVIGLIAINSILMGVNTYLPTLGTEDFDQAPKQEQSMAEVIALIDQIFLIIFTIELFMNVLVYLHWSFKDGWLLFDATTILTSWLLSGFTIMRSFRIFRVFRLFGRIPALKRIINAIASTAEGLGSIVFVLGILFYIFAVMCTQLFKDCWKVGCYAEDGYVPPENDWSLAPSSELGVNYFGRLDFTMFTLMLLMTQDDWASIVDMTGKEYPYAVYLLVIFMIISAIVMLNLVIAVLCEALNNLDEEGEGEKLEQENMREPIICTVNDREIDITKLGTAELAELFSELYSEKHYYISRDKDFEKSINKISGNISKLNSVINVLYAHK